VPSRLTLYTRGTCGSFLRGLLTQGVPGGVAGWEAPSFHYRPSLSAEEVALAYKGLWPVEATFRRLKDQLELGPIYHFGERRVRAHVAVCSLAFLVEVELERRLQEHGMGASFREVLSDLKRVKAVHLEVKGKHYLTRTELVGQA